MILVKKYPSTFVFCMENETNQDHEISKVSCLIKHGSKMSNVCPKQGQKVLEALAGHLYSNFP